MEDLLRYVRTCWIPRQILLTNRLSVREKMMLAQLNYLETDFGSICEQQILRRPFWILPGTDSKHHQNTQD